MDIFNRKKLAELQNTISELRAERDRYKMCTAELESKFEKMGELEETVPDGCVRGPWCKACEFVKTFHHVEYVGFGQHTTVTAYACGKGKSCSNFVQMRNDQ
jgi:hypothetical protein